MARLPKEGQDIGQWGGILNDFLRVGHNEDGTLKLPEIPDATPDATSEIKGKLRLHGDLGGTADDPLVTSTSLLAPLPLNQGGTGESTAPAALQALLPDQASHSGHVLTSDGTSSSWQPVPQPNFDDIHAMIWMEV